MEVRAKIVVMSHLSDVQFEMGMNPMPIERINNRINFAKYIMLECKGDLTQDINPDELWKKYLETKKQ